MFALLISSVVGYQYTAPILTDAGLILENQAVGKILGALAFASATFLVSAVVIGPLLVLVDIRKSVRVLETKRSGNGDRVVLAEHKEHYL